MMSLIQARAGSEKGFKHRFQTLVMRLRCRAALRITTRVLPWLFAAWMVWTGILWAVRLDALDSRFLFVSTTLVVGCWMSAILLSVWRVPADGRAALVMDRRLGSRELVTAAYGVEAEHPLAGLLRARAAELLSPSSIRESFPMTSVRAWYPTALSLLALVLTQLVAQKAPSPAADRVADPAVQEVLAPLSSPIAHLRQSLNELQHPEAETLLRPFDEIDAGAGLAEIRDLETAFIALGELEQAVGTLRTDSGARGMEERLRRLASTTTASASTSGSPRVDSGLFQGDRERMAEDLAALAGGLSTAGKPALAEALQQAEGALRAGDLEEAEERLCNDAGSEALQQAGQLGNIDRMSRQLQNQIQQARAQLGSISSQGGGQKPAKGSSSAGHGSKTRTQARATGGPQSQAQTRSTGRSQSQGAQGRNAGQGMGAKPGQGQGSGPGTGPGQGKGSGQSKGLGQQQGSGQGKGAGQGKGMGQGQGQGSGQGQGKGSGQGQGQGSGRGQGQVQGRSGPGPGQGSGAEASQGYFTGAPAVGNRQTERVSSGTPSPVRAIHDSELIQGSYYHAPISSPVGSEGETRWILDRGHGAGTTSDLRSPTTPAVSGGPEVPIDMESVPPDYREVIRAYFDRGDRHTVAEGHKSSGTEERDGTGGGQ